MKLKELINVSGELGECEVTDVTCDSRKVKNGSVYVAIKGSKSDGHDYAEAAINSGAAAVVTERDLGLEKQIVTDDTHAAFWQLSAAFYSNPADKLHLIGVTGTNGKTSVTYMLKKILEDAGHKVGLVGTIQNMIGDEVIETENTTPDAHELNRLFRKMYDAGCDYAVMECSSHALDQKRIYGVCFDVAIFTNLTQDHLDYHITMENYLNAKKKLFGMCKTAVVNFDDKYTSMLTEGLDCKVVTYSAESNNSTYSAKNIQYRADGVDYELVGYELIKRMKLSTGGKFTVYNSMAAAVAANEAGVSFDSIAKSFKDFCGVKGRAENVPTGRDFTLIIDYAHTPDGIENILTTFSECEKNRLIILFGCGGERDRTKRPIMGRIAAKYADFVIVTSDNPRGDNPREIIDDILVGLDKSPTPYKVIEDRTEAIKFALQNARKNDIIILAGKGHETYQILKTGKIHYDEREIVKDILNGMNR